MSGTRRAGSVGVENSPHVMLSGPRVGNSREQCIPRTQKRSFTDRRWKELQDAKAAEAAYRRLVKPEFGTVGSVALVGGHLAAGNRPGA